MLMPRSRSNRSEEDIGGRLDEMEMGWTGTLPTAISCSLESPISVGCPWLVVALITTVCVPLLSGGGGGGGDLDDCDDGWCGNDEEEEVEEREESIERAGRKVGGGADEEEREERRREGDGMSGDDFRMDLGCLLVVRDCIRCRRGSRDAQYSSPAETTDTLPNLTPPPLFVADSLCWKLSAPVIVDVRVSNPVGGETLLWRKDDGEEGCCCCCGGGGDWRRTELRSGGGMTREAERRGSALPPLFNKEEAALPPAPTFDTEYAEEEEEGATAAKGM